MLDNNSYITATSLDMYLVQVNTSSTTLPNKITFDEISGTGNQMKLGQGVAWDVLDSNTDLGWYYDDYEGGDLCFKDIKNNQELIIEKQKNRLIVWPSNFMYPHSVKPVTKGTRYSVVSWAV